MWLRKLSILHLPVVNLVFAGPLLLNQLFGGESCALQVNKWIRCGDKEIRLDEWNLSVTEAFSVSEQGRDSSEVNGLSVYRCWDGGQGLHNFRKRKK